MNIYSDVATGILKEIIKVRDAGAYSATIIMTYVAIDTMAFLAMPKSKKINSSKEFIGWVDKYMKTDINQSYQYDSKDMWAARCSKLHSYSPYSDFGTRNNCILYGYHDGSDHIFNPKESTRLALISVPRLVQDFAVGLKTFFEDALKDKTLKNRIDSRIEKVNREVNIDNDV